MKSFEKIYEEAILAHLPNWKEYTHPEFGVYLYRNTQDFVQWIGFDVSNRTGAIVASYSLQAFASQQRLPLGLLTSRINNKRGENLWITLDDWNLQSETIIEFTISRIKPNALVPISNKDVLRLGKNSRLQNPLEIEILGISLVLNSEFSSGKKTFEKALKRYEEIGGELKIENENRIRKWIECPINQLLPMLKLEAKKGSQLLGIHLDNF